MKNTYFLNLIAAIILMAAAGTARAQDAGSSEPADTAAETPAPETKKDTIVEVVPGDELIETSDYVIFDDQKLLAGYTQKFYEEPKHILMAMIKDDTLSPYKSAAAIRVFKERFSEQLVGRDKTIAIRVLVRRLKLTTSPFVQVEIMHALCRIDRYKYFKSLVPELIQKLDHYNKTVNLIAYESLDDIINRGNNRAREARIVFNTLRKVLFLSRKRIQDVKTPDDRLSYKLKVLRWSIKILGTQELKRLPTEVINLL